MGSILAAGDRFGDGSVVSRNAWLLKCIHWLLQVVLEGLSANAVCGCSSCWCRRAL